MGPFESATTHSKNQGAGRRQGPARRPRRRRCLLKGCEERFRPREARQRYCSRRCREAARQWSRRKAQQRYRETKAGRQKRNGQSRRYRKRIKSRKPPEPAAVNDAARVIPTEHFFRSLLRPAGLLRGIRAPAAKSLTTLLLAGLPARAGARPRPGAALETGAGFNPEILIHRRAGLTFSRSHATGVSPTGPALGAPAGAPSGATAATAGVAGRQRAANAHRGRRGGRRG